MNRSATGSPRRARVVLTLGIVGVAAVIMAARGQDPQQPPVPPAKADTQATVMDVIDSMAAASPAPVAAAAPTPAPVAAQRGGWPVDAAGRTLINGKPVIGRVFVQTKMDGLEAYEFANVYKGEAAQPDKPVIATTYSVPPVGNSRRARGIMVQATLWEIDHKRSATELRHHRPVTPASSLPAR